MADLSTDAIAALQAVEDWWLSQPGHQRDHGAPACIFMVREVLARHRRTAPPIFVTNGGSKGGACPTCAGAGQTSAGDVGMFQAPEHDTCPTCNGTGRSDGGEG